MGNVVYLNKYKKIQASTKVRLGNAMFFWMLIGVGILLTILSRMHYIHDLIKAYM